MLKKVVVAGDDFELDVSAVEGNDITTVSLIGYKRNEEKSTAFNAVYERDKVVEVYLSPEELRECVDGMMYILERIEREEVCIQ